MKKHLNIKKGELNATVCFPNLKLTVKSNEPVHSLKELNKILHIVKAIEFNREFYELDEDPLMFKLGYLSEEIKNSNESMDFIRTVSKIEENLRHKRISVENTKILDFQSNQCTSNIDRIKLKNKINVLCTGVEDSTYALIHITSEGNNEEKQGIIDLIRNKISRAEIKSLFTNKALLGKTVIEGVFFGPFEEEFFY